MAPSESSPLLNNISSPSQFFASKLFRNFKNTRKWAVGSLIKVGMGTVSTISSPSSSLRSSNIDWNYSNGMSTNTDPFSIVVRTYASLYGRRSYSSSNNTKESVNNEEKKIETKHETNAVIKKQTESDFLLTSIHDIDKYIQSHKNELTKEEAVHEFFKMMKFCLAYCQLHNGRVSKKLISLIYSVAKGVLKAVQNNSQFLRDIYNLLCMLEFKNYPALHMPCIQLAFGFRETKDIEMCASLFENHILPILQSVYESKSDFYSDYLLAAFILLPEFAVIREDFVEKIFECTSKFVPNDCYSLPNAVIIERNYSVQLLPTTNQSGLIQVLKYFSKYFFEYISSVETKSKKNGAFDGNILVASFKNIRRFGMQIEIQKYNYALEVLVRNNSPQATEFFEEILELGYTKPDETTYGTLVKHLSNNVKKGKEGHDLVMKCYNDMMESGRVNQKALTTFLTVTRYHSTRFQELREKIANQLYDWKEPLDQFSTTEAILHTIQKHGIEVAYEKLGDLRREGKAEMSPSVYNAILHAVSSDIQQVTIAFNVLNYMIEDKINPNDHILVSLLSIETKLHNLLYKPGKVDPVIVDRLERYKATIDSLLKDLIEDVCEGKAHNYVLISAAMKRFKDTQEYDKVIKIFENIRDRMTMEAKQDGSIYLIVMKSCESKKNVQALYECLEHLLRQELPVIPWQLYRHIISLISRIDFGTAEQKDHLVEQIYTKYAPLFADVDQLKRQVDPKCLAKTAWKIPPGKGLTSAEVAFIENAKQVIARKSQESSSVTIDEQTQ
ncbi:hypothetical protein C9374_003053 [Naegleria lovaniensis]|uniref:Pentacotripeptide-repeat region of PRORP domain-containing protein n=1 Tax=Naegleria lovaniensis TaxID=51637 RepID=A0AA88GTL5_NAELO|nr:uncharacterized protein C9374_003053 [Naegleria lovaniensis]KAG2385904.1 hypothetical protein C9374_003053 [Naegleria lovaniensis]